MIKKRFGKQMMGCKHIKGTKSYRCSPLHKKKSGGRKAGKGGHNKAKHGSQMRMAKKRAAKMPGGKGPVRNRPAGRKILGKR